MKQKPTHRYYHGCDLVLELLVVQSLSGQLQQVVDKHLPGGAAICQQETQFQWTDPKSQEVI